MVGLHNDASGSCAKCWPAKLVQNCHDSSDDRMSISDLKCTIAWRWSHFPLNPSFVALLLQWEEYARQILLASPFSHPTVFHHSFIWLALIMSANITLPPSIRDGVYLTLVFGFGLSTIAIGIRVYTKLRIMKEFLSEDCKLLYSHFRERRFPPLWSWCGVDFSIVGYVCRPQIFRSL